MKIYTKTGDKGTTALYGGKRVSKADLRIDSYGTVDELNSYIGLLRDQSTDDKDRNILYNIQNELFAIGAILATPVENKKSDSVQTLSEKQIETLEKEIDKINEVVEPLKYFILPGGHPFISHCHIARCVCRRAERLTVALAENEVFNELVVKYLNRLSDYLFTYARKLARDLKVEEVKWIS